MKYLFNQNILFSSQDLTKIWILNIEIDSFYSQNIDTDEIDTGESCRLIDTTVTRFIPYDMFNQRPLIEARGVYKAVT